MKNEIEKKAGLVEVHSQKHITEDVTTTGELDGSYSSINEQSLIVETEKGLLVIVGCSHPGLEKILAKAARFGSLYGVIGGFHDFNKYEVLEDLKLIVPTHCTQHKKEIHNQYKDKVKPGGVGWSIMI